MAGFASKVPFSMPFTAKKKHKFYLFSPSVSCSRLRKVQCLLKAENLDGILCIYGIDSRCNSGTEVLLNYLLFGFCNLSAEKISSKLTDEDLEDVVILIKPADIHVYCNPTNYPLLLPYIGHWRNLHLHCLAKQEEDEEKAEEFKIFSFISMVKGCSKIGIPFGHDPIQKSFQPFDIEKWPLVKAFALEGFGGGGFFTMVHEAVDVGLSLNQFYGSLDPVLTEILITEKLHLFERHCKSILTNIDVEYGTANSLTKLTESLVSEPIAIYFTHGQLSDNLIYSTSGGDETNPFVLFGVNTTKASLESVKNGSADTQHTNGTLSSCGIAGSTAEHMVCFAIDPKGTISCIRTYFFGNGYLPYTDSQTTSNPQSKDLSLLINLYLLAVDAVLDAIQSFVSTQDLMQAKSTVDAKLKLGTNRHNISLGPQNMKFSIEARDCLGREVGFETQSFIPVIKMATLYIYDIPSLEYPGKTIGSVAFGETFLDSAVKVLSKDNTSVWNCQHMILTENVSRYASWVGEDQERQHFSYLDNFAKSKKKDNLFGKQLVHGDLCYIIGETLYSKYEEGSLYVYEHGFIFINQRFGAVSLPLSVITRMAFYDGESSSSVALVMLTYHPSMASHIPPHLVNNNNTLVFALMPRTKVFRQFYSDVLPVWKLQKDNRYPALETVSELPGSLHTIYLYLQEHKSSSKLEMENTIENAMISFPKLKSFIAHLAVRSSSSVPVLSEDLAVLLGQTTETDTEENTNIELLLTVLTGVPGSGKDQLCNTLVALAKENSKWIILRSPITHTKPFDAEALQTSLSNTLTSQRKLLVRMSAGRKRVRVILVTPGFTDILEVVQAIYNHPKPEVKDHVKIGAVTCCVDPQNMFMEERYTLPKLLDQCAQGWVNNVVFTSCLDPQNEQLAMVQKLIRACNPDAAFILARGGEVTRSPDVELILSDNIFMKNSATQTRLLMCPGWSLGEFNPGPANPPVDQICINLFGPLDKHIFVSKLKALQGPIHLKDCLTSGAIHSIRGHIHFVDQNIVTEVNWTALKGSLTMNVVDVSAMPRPPSKAAQNGHEYTLSYFLVFTGFLLQESALKDWLRTCCTPRPQKKAFKCLQDLTKKELEQVTAKHKCDPLPEGWFYTGTMYVSLTGEKAFKHPLMDKFIQQYLTSANEEITNHNASVTALPWVDIFKRSPVH